MEIAFISITLILLHAKRTLLFAAITLAAPAAFGAVPPKNLETLLKQDLKKHATGSFEKLIQTWEKQYGAAAFQPLLRLASDRNNEDTERFKALMGATKIGGRAIASHLPPLFSDPSWMIRSGSLQSLRITGDRTLASHALPLLQDKALVVRTEAIETLRKLRPDGSVKALLLALRHPRNYHGGKALLVPKKALEALADFKDPHAMPYLRPLLDHSKDPELQKKTIQTLVALSGKALKEKSPLAEQVQAWKEALVPSVKKITR